MPAREKQITKYIANCASVPCTRHLMRYISSYTGLIQLPAPKLPSALSCSFLRERKKDKQKIGGQHKREYQERGNSIECPSEGHATTCPAFQVAGTGNTSNSKYTVSRNGFREHGFKTGSSCFQISCLRRYRFIHKEQIRDERHWSICARKQMQENTQHQAS